MAGSNGGRLWAQSEVLSIAEHFLARYATLSVIAELVLTILLPATPICHGCDRNTFETCVKAFNAEWHYACFKCKACNLPVQNMEFVLHEGFAYDEDCYYYEIKEVKKF
ncbi:unnamed protein product [Caenorhabditis bovis]|uniref:LIM zinc-binding domain-containing protein n=1 Tax=Caenorhabditis bovis TaxID=2654633 RepID=A0A8S1EBC7_9PELO|nr:unnamed protein product [Caenorhabditis bovis]